MIDSHCHLDFEPLNQNASALLQQCAEVGVTDIIVPGIAPDQWLALDALQQIDSGCRLWSAVGLHPWWVDRVSLSPTQLEILLRQRLERSSSGANKIIAIGECGLDGSIDCPLETQKRLLAVHLCLAEELQLPLILHGYKAHSRLLELLKQHSLPSGGVIHGFSGSRELAQRYWELGFYIGVGGTITYERASKTRAAIEAMPLESLLLETDAPDMPLCGFQGEPNSPLQLPKVAVCLAQLKGIDVSEVVEQTTKNTRRLFWNEN